MDGDRKGFESRRDGARAAAALRRLADMVGDVDSLADAKLVSVSEWADLRALLGHRTALLGEATAEITRLKLLLEMDPASRAACLVAALDGIKLARRHLEDHGFAPDMPPVLAALDRAADKIGGMA